MRRTTSLAALAIAIAIGLPATAPARSIYAPDIGWPVALRRDLHLERPPVERCDRPYARRDEAVQYRIDVFWPSAFDVLHRIFDRRWGGAWFDFCDRGRMGVGIAAGPEQEVRAALRRARAMVRRHHRQHDVHFYAVRSSYRQLAAAEDRLDERFAALVHREWMISSLDTSRNAVEIELASPVSPQDRAAVRTAARRSPANVIVTPTDYPGFHIDDL